MKGKKWLSSVLVLCLMAGLPVYADDIDSAKQEAQQIESQKQSAEGEKAALTQQLIEIVSKMEDTEKKISEKEKEINEKAVELVQAKNDENDQYISMKKRIRYMYENGNTQFIEILCKSKNITDFLNNAEYISTISEYDRDMLNQFKEIVKRVEKQEKELKDQYAQLETLQKDLEKSKESLTTLVANKEVEISSLDGKLGNAKAKIAALEAAAAEAQRKREEMAAAAAAAAAQQNVNRGGSVQPTPTPAVVVPPVAPVVSGNGRFAHPCPGYISVSSDFGYRAVPLPGATARHDGVDLAAPTGTPVYAADSGTVTHVGWFGTGGQAVIINHGNGMVTWYLHLSGYAVSQGQQVQRGQNVGFVGNTGNSTGPHLHFQVNIGGAAVNPWNYL